MDKTDVKINVVVMFSFYHYHTQFYNKTLQTLRKTLQHIYKRHMNQLSLHSSTMSTVCATVNKIQEKISINLFNIDIGIKVTKMLPSNIYIM